MSEQTLTPTAAGQTRSDTLVANVIAGVLGTAAFASSFAHVREVAARHGQNGAISWGIATSVELMAFAAVAEIRRRARLGQPVWVAVIVLLCGVGMSMAANLATAGPGVWGHTMAAWPVLAFLCVAAMIETRAAKNDTVGVPVPVRVPESVPVPAVPVPARVPGNESGNVPQTVPENSVPGNAKASGTPKGNTTKNTAVKNGNARRTRKGDGEDDAALMTQAQAIMAELGRRPTIRELKAKLNIGTDGAQRIAWALKGEAAA